MINIESIENKKLISDILDLTSNMTQIDFDSVLIDDWVRIDETNEMRLDIVAQAAYGQQDGLWVIAKFNGIGNPLTIKKDDVIAIPNLASFFGALTVRNFKEMKLKNEKKDTGAIAAEKIKSKSTSSASTTPSKKTQRRGNFTKTPNGNIKY